MSREPELCHMTMLLPWGFWKWLLRFYSLYSGKETRRKVISNQSMNNACHGQHLAYGTDLRQCSETSHLLEDYSLWIAALESGVDLIRSDISIRAFLKMRLCAGWEWIVLGMVWYPHVSKFPSMIQLQLINCKFSSTCYIPTSLHCLFIYLSTHNIQY